MKKVTKHALLMSALSLLLCVSMLVGTTYAWFTDSVTSAGNKIKSGTLDIQLLMHDGTDYVDISNSDKPIFGSETSTAAQNVNADTLWEPGKTQVAYLAIKNNGDLALKYKVALDVYDIDEKELYKVMEYSIVPNAQPTSGAVTGWPTTAESKTVVPGINIVSGVDAEHPDVSLDAGVTHYFALAIHMKENADNKYQDGKIKFDLRILAAQLEAESDSFDSKYDANAGYINGFDTELSEDFNGYNATVTVPVGAPEAYDLSITDTAYTNENGEATLSFNMKLLDKYGVAVSDENMLYPVVIKLPHPFVNMNNFKVYHNGVLVEGAIYSEEDLTVTFETKGFSPFEIKYTDYTDPSFELEYDENADGTYAITKGMFVGKNPADFDPSLKAADSEYIAVDFVKDGVKYYVVSQRATSVFVSADATASYGAFNAENVDFRSGMSDRLFELFNSNYAGHLANNEHSTVYLLPGTYSEDTTINVYSSLDIIGLGDAEDIKVVKVASHSTNSTRPSNRHLFNVNGPVTLSEHIQVTIRNLYLDAVESNTYQGKYFKLSDDNAAVQSIRMSKVKCYDLVIKDGNNAAPFYVNGGYAEAGAFMYVENCAVISSIGKIETSTTTTYPQIFYYNGLTHKNGTPYTGTLNGKAVVKEQYMSADDWWEQ